MDPRTITARPDHIIIISGLLLGFSSIIKDVLRQQQIKPSKCMTPRIWLHGTSVNCKDPY